MSTQRQLFSYLFVFLYFAIAGTFPISLITFIACATLRDSANLISVDYLCALQIHCFSRKPAHAMKNIEHSNTFIYFNNFYKGGGKYFLKIYY